jgi:hypothetical protein
VNLIYLRNIYTKHYLEDNKYIKIKSQENHLLILPVFDNDCQSREKEREKSSYLHTHTRFRARQVTRVHRYMAY